MVHISLLKSGLKVDFYRVTPYVCGVLRADMRLCASELGQMAARGGGGQRGSALRLQEYEPQARGESGQRAHAAVSVSTSTRRWGPSRLQSAQFLNSLNKLFKVLASVFIFYSIQTSTITGVFYSIQVQKRHYSDSLFRIIHIQDPP